MKTSLFLSIAALGAVISNCSTASKVKVEHDVSEQSKIESPHQAVGSGRFAVKQSPYLTEEEKKQFLALMDRTEISVSEIKKQEGQIKASLFQSLSQKNFNSSDLTVYKEKLKTLEDKKLSLMFSSLDEARNILHADQKEKLEKEIQNFYQSTLER